MLNLTPTIRPQHWCSAHIGKPWALGHEGPASFDCWGLARYVQQAHYSRALPQLQVASTNPPDGQIRALLGLMRRGGWEMLQDWKTMRDGDLLRMQGQAGPHIGVAVMVGPYPVTVLHCLGAVDVEGRSHGAVERAETRQLVSEGFGQFQAWRWA